MIAMSAATPQEDVRLPEGGSDPIAPNTRAMPARCFGMHANEIGEAILGCGLAVHRHLGPGLLESAYEHCLGIELLGAGLRFDRQVALPIRYRGKAIDLGYRIDLLVEKRVVVEVKSIERVLPVHEAQLVSYLRLGGFALGYLLNFNVPAFRLGIRRKVNQL